MAPTPSEEWRLFPALIVSELLLLYKKCRRDLRAGYVHALLRSRGLVPPFSSPFGNRHSPLLICASFWSDPTRDILSRCSEWRLPSSSEYLGSIYSVTVSVLIWKEGNISANGEWWRMLHSFLFNLPLEIFVLRFWTVSEVIWKRKLLSPLSLFQEQGCPPPPKLDAWFQITPFHSPSCSKHSWGADLRS